MLRLTDIKLPLDHPESALRDAILARLGIAADELTGYTVARRSVVRVHAPNAKRRYATAPRRRSGPSFAPSPCASC